MQSITHVTKLLADAEPAVRIAAAESLRQFGSSSAIVVDQLLKALPDIDASVRCAVVKTLGAAGREPGVVPALFEALNDSDKETSVAAANAIRGMRPPLTKSDLPLLIKSLESPKVETRRICASELARIGGDARSSFPKVLGAMKDTDLEVRSSLFDLAGKIGPDARAAAPTVAEVVTETAKTISADADTLRLFGQATATLVKVDEPGHAVAVLVDAIKTNNSALRKNIIEALMAAGEPARKAVPDLCSFLGDEEVGQLAGDALLKLGGPDVVKALAIVVDKRPVASKMEAIRVLGTMGRKARAAYGILDETYRLHRGKALGDAAHQAMQKIDR